MTVEELEKQAKATAKKRKLGSVARFRDLAVGDRFDFVSPARLFNSFYAPCTKVSARKYCWDAPAHLGIPKLFSQVGTINVLVYHVNKV